jgi:DNA-binding LacI/PurR family transcriptional regulator
MESRQRPTVQQVADRAGVSTATVSNALNGTGRLSEATRQRVIAAARELSYLPYAAARAHARGGTGVLGLTLATHGDLPVPYTEIPYYAQLVLAAIKAAHEQGYLLMVLPATLTSWAWLTTPLDGVIHTDPRADDPVDAVLAQREIPIVYGGRPPHPRRTAAWVDSTYDVTLVELLEHLRSSGRSRVAVVVPDHDDAYASVVRDAYRSWCEGSGQEPLVATFTPTLELDDERPMLRRLLSGPDRPDAVIGVYDYSGTLLLELAAELGLSVPGDLAIACFSDNPDYAHLDPPITTISLSPAALGAESVSLLVALLNGRRGLARQRLTPSTLHLRRSTEAGAVGSSR